MPVFRVPAARTSSVLRQSLVDRLKKERRDPSPSGEPLIFEMPVEGPDRIEVLVVWQEWESVPSFDRAKIILEAYEDNGDIVAQAVGATYEEAMQQQLLPYAVASRCEVSPKFLSLTSRSPGEAKERLAAIRKEKLEMGGTQREGEKVELRFPTRKLAEQACSALTARLPDEEWWIDHSSGSDSEML